MAARGPEIGLGSATLLELGLSALERGDVPAAVGALAAIDEAAWWAIMTRFPDLVEYVRNMISAQAWRGRQ